MANLAAPEGVPGRNINYTDYDKQFFGDLEGDKRPYQPFILDLVTKEKLYFQTIPYEISDTAENQFVNISMPGRNNPRYQYTGSEDALTFTMSFYCNHESRMDVIKKAKWLQALGKNDGYENPPHEVVFAFGVMYKNSRWLVESAKIRYSNFNREFGMLACLAYIDVVLKRVTDDNRKRSNMMRYDT